MQYPSPTQRVGMEATAVSAAATTDSAKSGAASRTLWGDAWKRLRQNKLAIVAAIWIIFVALVAITADLWAQQWLGSPTAADTTAMATSSLLPPSLEHPFGTDVTGRDILVRVIYGARISLTIGLLATAISTVIGLVMGALAAYYGGIFDTIIMRAADIFLAFPYVLFVLCLIAALGQSITNVFVAIGILGWPSIARVFRSAILSVKESDYVGRRPCHGRFRRAHHRPSHLPQLRRFHRGVRHNEHRLRHPHRGFHLVPGHGRPAAQPLLGHHDPGRSGLSHDRAVAHDHARSGDSFDGARVHAAG